jgi:hypothetical protein
VSVFPAPVERNTTRYPRDWQEASIATSSLSVTVSGQMVTVGGSMPSPFTAHVLSLIVDGQVYPYQVQPTDSLASIAGALASLVGAQVSGVTVAGAVITLPGSARLSASRVGVTGSTTRELRRQERQFRITAWADTPEHRAAVASLVDVTLCATDRFDLPDGYSARLRYHNSIDGDGQQKANLYRRDLIYSVEYATTQSDTATQVTQVQMNTSGRIDGATQDGPVTTTYF